ncbi:MAG: 4'-phosphopantetheinyl transferase superfamily protein [Deltaproteobacteria bacterium]|nr:4'-phosphopantetheinyl transferase superfamily protein [Deltaproteobacteria bacterium]
MQKHLICPVILAVPNKKQQLMGREKVSFLSRHARRALEISAQKRKIQLGDLEKNENGAPLPFNGNYWSVTHKTEYVGGVIARARIGIDLEKIRPVKEALYRKTARESEWGLSATDKMALFFRFWTSKESVLKASGTGIRDLLKCRIKRIIDDRHLVVNYKEYNWDVEHLYFNGHIASVVKNNVDVKWVFSQDIADTSHQQ